MQLIQLHRSGITAPLHATLLKVVSERSSAEAWAIDLSSTRQQRISPSSSDDEQGEICETSLNTRNWQPDVVANCFYVPFTPPPSLPPSLSLSFHLTFYLSLSFFLPELMHRVRIYCGHTQSFLGYGSKRWARSILMQHPRTTAWAPLHKPGQARGGAGMRNGPKSSGYLGDVFASL